MREGEQSLAVVVRSELGLSLTLAATEIAADRVVLVGMLIDPETPSRDPGTPSQVDTTIKVAIAPEMQGTHIEGINDLILVLDDAAEYRFRWEIERLDLGDSYVLRDARVHGDIGEMRVFAIEDIVVTTGAAIAAAAGAVFLWREIRSSRREKRAHETALKLWDDCLACGGSPKWAYEVEDEIGLDGSGLPKIKSRGRPSVRCDMSRAM